MRNLVLGLFVLAPTACSGALDNSGPDVPPVHVQVVVSDGEVPQSGVRVIFQDASDVLVEEALTGVDGRAVAELPDGGNVSVIRTYPMAMIPEESKRTEVYTYIGVKAGDILELGGMVADAGTPSAINVMVPETAVGTVTINTPCGSGQGQAPIIALTVKNCPASITFYVMDSDGSSFVRQMPYSENIDLTGELFVTSLSSSVGATNVPLDTAVSVERRLELNGFELYSSGPQRVEAQTQNVDVPQLVGVDQVIVAAMSNAGRTQVVVSHGTFAPGPIVVDASVGMIPYVAEPLFTPAGITWTEEGTGIADMVIVALDVTREIPDGGMPGIHNEYVRTIIAPHAGTTLRIPNLPGTGILYNPGENDSVGLAHGLATVTGGYDAVRARAFRVPNIIDATPMGASATLSYTGAELPGLGR